MVKRHLEDTLTEYLFKGKTVIVYGARQTGKTTLVEELIKKLKIKSLMLNGDDADIRELFSSATSAKFKPVIGDYKLIVIDEAQRIPDAGLGLKIMHDSFKDVQLIVTGSSSLELAEKTKEPMTGRKSEFWLSPFSFGEMAGHHGFLAEKRLLEQRLIYGYYPDVALNTGNEKRILKTLASDYLYKDILAMGNIKKPVLLDKILKALALQVGNEVSYNELAQLLDSDKGTIEKYIDLLEKTFIVFRLPGLNRNVRNEIKKGKKIYFCDNGIRNAVLGNFQPLVSRVDTGALWENFLVSERYKLLANNDEVPKTYFWRTTQQQEIDYIEEYRNSFFAYEFKWRSRGSSFLSKTFSKAYPVSEFRVITPDNFHEFLMIT
ncbi:MAG: ATP-binding protein [Bacteroidales bacterium]|nr:ATP-binding protein [Bacteroidales bacterium]